MHVLTRTWVVHLFFFFNDTATTEIYTLSLHDALPISGARIYPRDKCRLLAARGGSDCLIQDCSGSQLRIAARESGGCCFDIRDRKSTRLNSSHLVISYAVFCLKTKNLLAE